MNLLDKIFGPPIYTYTRAMALGDGSQVEVTEMAKQAGFTFRVFMTRTTWESCVTIPEGVKCQDEGGRLWDVLWMLRHGIKRAGPEENPLRFSLYVRNNNRGPKLCFLKAVCSAVDLDDPAPSITIMLPTED